MIQKVGWFNRELTMAIRGPKNLIWDISGGREGICKMVCLTKRVFNLFKSQAESN